LNVSAGSIRAATATTFPLAVATAHAAVISSSVSIKQIIILLSQPLPKEKQQRS
jgi:hypothetical protein